MDTISVRFNSRLLDKIDRIISYDNEVNHTKKNRTDFIREACMFYANAVRCDNCGAINNPRALSCSVCNKPLSLIPNMKKSISDILAEIDKLYSKIHAHLSMARSDLDEVWYWIELGGEVEDLLYQKTDLENLEDYNRYEEELKVFEEKYAMYCHFEKIDGREVLVQETCRTSKLISDTKELLQTIDTNRFKNPRNGIIGERSDKSKMIFLRSAKNECKNEVTSLCDDLEKINGLSLELENLRMEVDMLHELDDLRKKRK